MPRSAIPSSSCGSSDNQKRNRSSRRSNFQRIFMAAIPRRILHGDAFILTGSVHEMRSHQDDCPFLILADLSKIRG